MSNFTISLPEALLKTTRQVIEPLILLRLKFAANLKQWKPRKTAIRTFPLPYIMQTFIIQSFIENIIQTIFTEIRTFQTEKKALFYQQKFN